GPGGVVAGEGGGDGRPGQEALARRPPESLALELGPRERDDGAAGRCPRGVLRQRLDAMSPAGQHRYPFDGYAGRRLRGCDDAHGSTASSTSAALLPPKPSEA